MAKFLDYTGLESLWAKVKALIVGKQDAPSTAGTAGQVLGLDTNLEPVWTTPSASAPPEVYVGSDTPSGYTLYIEPGTGGVASGNEVEY